jgi:putative transposase
LIPSTREKKGILLFRAAAVRQVDGSRFRVSSQKGRRDYEVYWDKKRWRCSCEDFERWRRSCKHIYAVMYYLDLRNIVYGSDGGEEEGRIVCPRCGHNRAIRKGYRKNEDGPVQRFLCKECGYRFTNRAFLRAKKQAGIVVAALDSYFRGMSLRQTAEHLTSVFGVRVSATTVLRWLKRYVGLINERLQREKKVRTERWNADDTIVRLKGRYITFWSLIDERSRYLLALEVSRGRSARCAEKALKRGIERGGEPREIVTDAAKNYEKAIDKTLKKRGTVHIMGPGLSVSTVNNNKIERFHGVMKSRIRQLRLFQTEESARSFAGGYRIFYNYIKSHRALNNRTPAQALGLKKERLGWKKLILTQRQT